MKKQYMNPSTECAMMNVVTMLCTSVPGPTHTPMIQMSDYEVTSLDDIG